MDINKVFGNKLKEIRAEMSITQEELALKCDMQPSHIGQLERGIKSPTLETLYRIAYGLNMSIAELVDFQGKLDIPNTFDDKTNKIVARLQRMSDAERNQVLTIVKTFK